MIYEQQVSEKDYLLVIGQSWPWGNHVTGKKKIIQNFVGLIIENCFLIAKPFE